MKRGFTLAEILIALTLTAVAIAIMSEGVRRTIEFQSRLTNVRAERETMMAVSGAIRSRIDHLVPANRAGTEAGGSPQTLFSGESGRLAFIAADPGYPSRAGLYEYRLELLAADEEENLAPRLRLSRRPIANLAEFGAPAGARFESWDLPLNGGLEFRYGNTLTRLQPVWTDTGAYPAFVALIGPDESTPAMLAQLPRPSAIAEPDDEPAP
ncbi:prepilin-type N-terminal cleavage/methylation domain-containing protein [Hyphobacterium sp.]|uniref:prepilin-type N-terminal cleavage/methylation domain-containing protein n=1 Tax=Hyphobacterium sp. TaxID=2004662 RepID=UPI003BABDF2D